MENLQNQNAIVTGGGRGLGKATALAFAKEGINVAITGRNENNLKETVSELQALGVKATYAIFDISNYEEVKAGLSKIIEEFKTIDILVNNAGIAQFGSILDMDPKTWADIVNTNLLGAYYVTREVLPYLIKNGKGDIFNVSSTAGLNGNAGTSAYSASKFGLIGLSESVMREVRKHNIRVCTLTPSTIASDMSKELNLTDGNPESVLQPEDFADLIVGTLRLPRRALLKSASIWSTNP